MLGFIFAFFGFVVELFIVDTLDRRYNTDLGIAVLPWFNVKWAKLGEGKVVTLCFGWLNLEFSILFFDEDVYYDELERLIDEDEENNNND